MVGHLETEFVDHCGDAGMRLPHKFVVRADHLIDVVEHHPDNDAKSRACWIGHLLEPRRNECQSAQ